MSPTNRTERMICIKHVMCSHMNNFSGCRPHAFLSVDAHSLPLTLFPDCLSFFMSCSICCLRHRCQRLVLCCFSCFSLSFSIISDTQCITYGSQVHSLIISLSVDFPFFVLKSLALPFGLCTQGIQCKT